MLLTLKSLLAGGGQFRRWLGTLMSVGEQARSTYGTKVGRVGREESIGPDIAAKGLLGGGGELRPYPGR